MPKETPLRGGPDDPDGGGPDPTEDPILYLEGEEG